jgi:N utilization substance protein A
MVVNELRGEKVDIVPFSEDSVDFVMKALSPARVKEVRIDEETGTAEVIVPDYQLSLAIGKEGQNARLAARLTGWRVDIKSETQLAEEAAAYEGEEWAEGEWVKDEASGEMVWKPAEGGEGVSAQQWAAGPPAGEAGQSPPDDGSEVALEPAPEADPEVALEVTVEETVPAAEEVAVHVVDTGEAGG